MNVAYISVHIPAHLYKNAYKSTATAATSQQVSKLATAATSHTDLHIYIDYIE